MDAANLRSRHDTPSSHRHGRWLDQSASATHDHVSQRRKESSTGVRFSTMRHRRMPAGRPLPAAPLLWPLHGLLPTHARQRMPSMWRRSHRTGGGTAMRSLGSLSLPVATSG